MLMKIVFGLKKYNVITKHDYEIENYSSMENHHSSMENHHSSMENHHSSTKNHYSLVENGSVLSILSPQDGKVKRTKVGYTMELTNETFQKIKKHPKTIHIEEDKVIKMAYVEDENRNTLDYIEGLTILGDQIPDTEILKNDQSGNIKTASAVSFILQHNTPWGLSKISGNTQSYEYIKNGGENVIVYVLDTGIDIKHPEFEGRAFFKYNAIEGSPDIDEQGHGTHCAGVVGSKTYGVAKKARLYGVKILDKHGEGSISKLIEGIDFVIENYNKELEEFNRDRMNSMTRNSAGMNKKLQAVINMSVGGEKSIALNYAILHASRDHNIHFSTAAGNENKDACEFSPSSSSMSLTIGASDNNDFIAKFSNEGVCVNLFAPGVQILSTWPGNRTKKASGTSMATPHVTGIMAVYLSLAEFKPEELKKRILEDSEKRIREYALFPLMSNKKPFASLKSLYDRLKFYDFEE